MSDYASLKVPELKKLLQEKSLPVTGNKADLIARLQEHDKPKAEPARENEDEIDYSDDDVPTTAKSTEPAKAAGSVEPAPVAVAVEEKPADTSASEPAKIEAESTVATDKPAESETAAEETAKTEALKADFSAHLPASNADEETRKRAERAKRFGIVENEEEKKKNARAERFGVDQSSLAAGLDSALPEKRAPKRGREGGNTEGERGAKRQNPGGRHRGKGRSRHGGGGRQGGAPRKEGNSAGAGAKGRSSILNDPTEKAKAEARAKRFGGGS